MTNGVFLLPSSKIELNTQFVTKNALPTYQKDSLVAENGLEIGAVLQVSKENTAGPVREQRNADHVAALLDMFVDNNFSNHSVQ